MAAFNYILVSIVCPVCQEAVDTEAQTHVASSFDGDETGRFNDRRYRLGERMRWWAEEHKEYARWRENGRIGYQPQGQEDWECCYAACSSCKAELYVLIRFEGPRPVAVEGIGPESDWPEGFYA